MTAEHVERASPTCGCCGRIKQRMAELGGTPGVYICRLCALWAWRRASRHPGQG